MIEPAVETRIETFEDFFHATYGRLLRTMFLSTGDRHEAEDLAQDAMARVYERWDRVAALEDPAGYAFRTALNLRRSRLRRVAVAARRALRIGSPAPETDAVDERDAIGRALAGLPHPQRTALVLCDWLEMSAEEAGTVLRITPGAVRVRLHRARAAMRETLGGPDE